MDIFRSIREPSIVDRVGGLGASKLDAQNRAYDKMAADREKLIGKLVDASNKIHERTVRAKANWVRCGDPAIAKLLDPTGEHTEVVDNL